MVSQSKAEYVLDEPNSDPNHHCHWPGCTTKVKPAMWGCRKHWFMLPKELRDRIWKTYRPGQEKTKDPSRDYLRAAADAQRWIEENHPATMS